MSSSGESYLTLHVTYHQEMAIKNLYTSKGWLFKKKVLKVLFVDPDTEEAENEIVSDKVTDVSVNEIPNTGQDTQIERHSSKGIVSSSNKTDNPRVVIEKLKVETSTDEQDREGNDNDEPMFDDDTDDNADDWVPNLNDNSEDDNDNDEDDEEYTPVKGTKGRKRKSGGLKLTIKKGTSGKKARRSRTSETVTQSTPEKSIPSTSTAETERDETVEDDGINVQNIVKTEGHEAPTEDGNVDLGVDTDRTALEIELQETDDIDHYETVHKTLSPDEPFSPPSDVQESDGFSPSLGCYYCHDCGYTFQLQRWYNIHKWDGRCVYTCQVCSMKFTFRNITAYRDHLKTHKNVSYSNESAEIHGLGESFQDKADLFECEICSYKTKFKWNLKRHLHIHSNATNLHETPASDVPNKPIHVCDTCGKTFRSKYGLSIHMKSKHTSEFRFKCGVCSKGFMSVTHYRGHLASHNKILEQKCPQCPATFRYRSSLMEHHNSQHKGMMFKCNDNGCEKEFKTPRSLIDHRRAVHAHRHYVCPKCNKVFKWRSGINFHEKHAHLND